ncbi:hypothetical protein Agub_g10641 [Astrephomene gubernaculifera]|uniref:Uncharacterized protein n=1 Tax=Astrephomene gubernaculifera TaxID=47775 RepID=A0AAD3DVD1_9CHLO|nr:hypothetical protein Agub_g10641 [Astrephomene gubernaculifera]
MAPLRWLSLATLCCLVASALSASAVPDLAEVVKLKLRLPKTSPVHRTFGRDLLESTVSMCLWSSSYTLDSCDLNLDYITSLGTPSTNSQKLLAYVAALNNRCSNYTSSSSCTATPSEYCAWDSTFKECSVGPSFLKQGWLQNVLYCSGSRADIVMTCVALNQTSCGSNSNCVWQNTTQLAQNTIGTSLMNSLAEYAGHTVSSSSSVCAASWATNTTYLTTLASKIAKAETSASAFSVIFTDLFGDCSALTTFKSAVTTCSNKTTQATCDAQLACSWTNECDLAEDFVMDLLLDSSDPWVAKYTEQSLRCAAQTTSSACKGLATTTVDTTKYSSYLTLTPFSGAGMMSASSLLISLMAGLVCLWGMLL